MKVREIITLDGWVDGGGWSYSTCYSDSIIDIGDILPDNMDWDWWEVADEQQQGGDTKITVEYYAVDAAPGEDDPLSTYSTWESDLIKDND